MAKKRNCFNMLGIAVAAAVIILVLMQDSPSTIENFEASSSNFMDSVSSGKKLVWFYAPWCGHCKSMHKDWDNAAAEVNLGDKTMVKVDVGDRNNPEHAKINKQFGISGYPTILLLNNGKKEREYNGGRTQNDFINFCKQNNLAI